MMTSKIFNKQIRTMERSEVKFSVSADSLRTSLRVSHRTFLGNKAIMELPRSEDVIKEP
jgi:hypothetical protein